MLKAPVTRMAVPLPASHSSASQVTRKTDTKGRAVVEWPSVYKVLIRVRFVQKRIFVAGNVAIISGNGLKKS